MKLLRTILFAVLLCLQTADAVSLSVTDAGDSGPGTLRAAIASANKGDTIRFALVTPAVIGLTSAELQLDKGVTILGPGPSSLVVSGGHQRQVFIVNTPDPVTISGLTVANGDAGIGRGGGLANSAGMLTVSNCVVADNQAGDDGGAIYNAGHLQLINSTVKYNTTTLGNGGGLSNRGGTALITNCTFSVNSTWWSAGGAIYNLGGFGSNGTVVVAGSLLNANSSSFGGAIANDAQDGMATLVVIQSSIDRNTVHPDIEGDGRGGGIHNEAAGGSAQVAIIDTTINWNSAPEGAGVANYGDPTSVGITNSTISGNTAFCPFNYECTGSERGGGIFSSSARGTVYVVNSTLAGNTSAQYGSAIYVESPGGTSQVVIASSLFDADKSIEPILLSGANAAVNSLGYNLCSDSGSGYLTNPTDQTNTDPMLGRFNDNGGPMWTHAPLPGSPAIDKGRNFSGSATDQRGFPRTVDIAGIPNAPAGDATDIGAVESQDTGFRLRNFGVVSGQFSFNLVGPFSPFIVEASTNLSNWTAVATNTLTDAPLRFTDPSFEPSHRFYRARLQ